MNANSNPAASPWRVPELSFVSLMRLACFVSPLILWLLPSAVLGNAFTVVEQRMLAVLLFAVVFWILEPIPVFATSVLVIFLQVIFLSDSAFVFLRNPEALIDAGANLQNMQNIVGAASGQASESGFGRLIPYKELFHSFASPVIMLFLGGFFLSGAATKYGLDKNLARVFLKPFGNRVEIVMLGVMFITAFFSLWMANTPVTAMMLAITAPVIGLFEEKDPGRVGFLLAVPIASSLGGIGTPVGTPVNAIALKYLTGGLEVSFAQWMLFGLPYVLVMVLVSWFLLTRMFPSGLREIKLELAGTFDRSPKALIVYAVFPLTILLWLTSTLHGINTYAVALFPVAIFVATGVITKFDLKKMSWDVLWLIAGGIALGVGLEQTGLTGTVVQLVPFSQFDPWMLVICATAVTFLIATIMSHTATANLLIPIMAVVGPQNAGLESLGGTRLLLFSVAVTCSIGMALPISTPCNALAYASGGMTNKQMMLGGGVVSLVGVLLILALVVAVGAFM